MTITNFILIQMINTLKTYEDRKLPQKISYAIIKTLMSLENEYAVYQRQIDKIFAEYDDKFIKNDKGSVTYRNNGLPLVKDEYAEEFNSELQNLLNSQVEVNIYSVDDELFNYDDTKFDSLTAKEISILSDIICKPKEDETQNE